MISSLELARLCGVSQGTVDRALHNRPGIRASTREKILQIAAEHGYRPNPAVQELLSGQSQQIVAIFPGTLSIFFMDLMNALSGALAANGLRLVMIPAAGGRDLLTILEDCAARRAAGIVIVPPRSSLTIPQAISTHLPVATLVSKCRGTSLCHIAPDEVLTGRTAVDYLTGLGHRRILHITYPSRHSAVRERRKGYELRMGELGLAPRVATHLDAAALSQALKRHAPTAVFCHNDWLALSVIRQLHALGCRVPEAISVLGVDNSPAFHDLCPTITSLAYPMRQIADATVAWLRDRQPPPDFGALPVIERETTRRLA